MTIEFKAISAGRLPVKGDLVRSKKTADFINVVLEVYPVSSRSCKVRSVRYAKVHNGEVELLGGTRSREFTFECKYFAIWEIVKEYDITERSEKIARLKRELRQAIAMPNREVDNKYLIEGILKNLEGVETRYVPSNTSEESV